MRSKIVTWFLSTLSAALAIIGGNSSVAWGESEAPYRIGVIVPLSGEVASLGNFLRHGIELAYADLPKDQRERIELIFEDDQMQSSRSVSAFQMLKSTKAIDAVLVAGSGVGNAVAPLAEKSGTLMVAIGASDKSLAQNRKLVFIHWVSPEAEGAEMVKEIIHHGYKRIAMLSHEQQGVIAFNEAFLAEMKRAGLGDRVVLNERFAIDNKDFNTFIAKARQAKADGIYLCLLSGGLSTFVRRAHEVNLPGEIFGAETFEDEHEVKASGGTMVGTWYVNADDASADFVARYKAKFSEYPGWGAANAYDTLSLIADGVARNGKDNGAIADQFRSVKDYHGAAGTYSASGDNRFTLPATAKRVTANGFEKLR